ncbi:MAG: hypothetical protein WAU33_00250 [Candidatus Binataceae bacterium]
MSASTPEPRGECRLEIHMLQQDHRTRHVRPADRMTKCLWCRAPVRHGVAAKHRGVCPLCIAEIAELKWRVVYDRERGLGSIPPNLRAAYSL